MGEDAEIGVAVFGVAVVGVPGGCRGDADVLGRLSFGILGFFFAALLRVLVTPKIPPFHAVLMLVGVLGNASLEEETFSTSFGLGVRKGSD